ncbi:hypothetical protein ACFPM3_00015 [Streptomyces coeruleoprunus]|uniref:Uncharacterized protein n=1 Tax=Streptomyces coeruleoprunus TaxID=285563 RepID=A0ABV9X4U2_9ACTN
MRAWRDRPIDPTTTTDDPGCLRVVLVAPLLLLTLITAYFCWTALSIRPSGPWDDDAYAGITLSCVLAMSAAGAVTAVWILPSVRRALPWWCVSPSLCWAWSRVCGE